MRGIAFRFLVFLLGMILIIGLCVAGCRSSTRSISNPTEPMVLLGRDLFYDNNLSINRTRSCGTCHNPDFAFTDGYKRSLGAFGDLHQRNTQSLFNLGEQLYLTSADSTLHDVYQQMEQPLFNRHPVEMGAEMEHPLVLNRIRENAHYRKMLEAIFPQDRGNFTWHHIRIAIRAFVYSLRSVGSRFDAYLEGKPTLNPEEMKGMRLFFSPRMNCAKCHGGKHFNTPVLFDTSGRTRFYFNIGLYALGPEKRYPAYDEGLFQKTGNPNDIGRFRVPTLRNLGFTAPYFHDGSAATLEEVLDVYASGGRVISSGEFAGDGRNSPHKENLILGFSWTPEERRQLIAFLRTLDDTAAVTNPAYRVQAQLPSQK